MRVYAGLHLRQSAAYDMGMLTFVLALLHFGWELLVEGTVGGAALVAAEITPIVSVVWMAMQRNYYLSSI